MMDIKESYKELSKKSNLPSFEQMDAEFEISDIKEGNLIKKIAEKIVCKVQKYREILEGFLQPDGNSLAVLIEIKNMNEADNNKINSLYRDLIVIEREYLLADLEDKQDIIRGFIEKSIQKWNEIRPQLKEIFKKAKDSWKTDIKVKEELGYMG